jgi:hypothetical protein
MAAHLAKNGFKVEGRSRQLTASDLIYFMRNCKAGIETVPTLPRDEKNQDDVDSDAEDHWYDSARYKVLTGGRRFVGNIKITYPNSR